MSVGEVTTRELRQATKTISFRNTTLFGFSDGVYINTIGDDIPDGVYEECRHRRRAVLAADHRREACRARATKFKAKRRARRRS